MITQKEQINELRHDLNVVLENFKDDIETDQLFYNSIKFMTAVFYKCSGNHKHTLKILKLAFDDGFKNYIDNTEK